MNLFLAIRDNNIILNTCDQKISQERNVAIKSRIFQFDWYKKKIGVENFPKIRTKVSKYYFRRKVQIHSKNGSPLIVVPFYS